MQHVILRTIAKQIRERGSDRAVSGSRALTYSELDRSSAGVASALSSLLGGQRGRVLVLSSEPATFIPALLGVLRAECTYVPVLSDLPATRLEFIVRKVRPAAVLHDARSRSIAEAHFPSLPHLGLEVLEGKADWPELPPDHPAYVYFTSGSTGEPKGIVGRYASLSQFIHWEASLLGLQRKTNVSQLVSPMFDAFLRDVLLPLSVGGCCCVPEDAEREDASRLADWLVRSQVEVVHTVPSVFRTLVGALSDKGPTFPVLRHVLLSGEALLPSDAALWARRLGEEVSLYNLYGATETTMIKFCYRVSRDDATAPAIPVGRPIDGASAWIADQELQPLVDGEIGEIMVETEFRTLGYLDDREATDRVFVPVPGAPARIAYRTGDLGRRRFDAVFEFLGRKDRQVKIRGVRIEPSEIEDAARALPGVLDCTVDVESQTDGTTNLALYAVLTHGLTSDDLRAHLQERLPAPYLPSAVRACRELPRLLSGKVDFTALRATAKATRSAPVPAATPSEAFVLELFRQLVQDHGVGVEDNFFDVGGHSLLAIQVLSRVREERRVEVPLASFFGNSTARGLAEFIDRSPTLPAPTEAAASEEKRIDLAALSDQDLEQLLTDLLKQE